MSSSSPRQNPCGELNCPLLGPNWPNLHLICIGLTLFERGITAPTDGTTGWDTIVFMGSGIMSSGVESRGDVEDDTAPKPFINVLVKFNAAAAAADGEFARTSIPPFESSNKIPFYSKNTFDVVHGKFTVTSRD